MILRHLFAIQLIFHAFPFRGRVKIPMTVASLLHKGTEPNLVNNNFLHNWKQYVTQMKSRPLQTANLKVANIKCIAHLFVRMDNSPLRACFKAVENSSFTYSYGRGLTTNSYERYS